MIYLHGEKQFKLSKEFVTIDYVVLEIERRFKNQVFESTHFDFGDNIVLDDIPNRYAIEKIIRHAMEISGIKGDLLSWENQ